ncbi:MAG: hypothetical protein AABZ47_04185 [Planctomycetota bacterium]
MPQTYMDDVGAVLPSAVTGPFQVFKSGDSGSFIKIDPASAKIEAAGTARPTRRIVVPVSRVFGAATNASIDTALDAKSLSATLDTGFYAIPFAVPADMDLTEESRAKLLIAPTVDGGDGTVIRFELTTTYGKDGDTSVVTSVVTHDFTAPSGWTVQDLKSVTIDTGGGNTYAVNTFESTDMVGLLIKRLGSASQDTFANALYLASALVFEYTAKVM